MSSLPKILVVSNYLDGTGWSAAGIGYILALDAAGLDVVCRPLKLNDYRGPVPRRIQELEDKDASGCDVVIQHTLPVYFDYNGRFSKNIGLFVCETDDFSHAGWADRINTMDEVWVPCEANVQACYNSGVQVPVRILPHATDITRFQRSYAPLEELKPYREQGEFLFYTIGEAVRRKNLAALVKAFHLEFDHNEPVRLVIKTSVPGMSPDAARENVSRFCDDIKKGLRIRKTFKEELILTERLSDEGILRLHASCDVFVQPSYSESWSIPAFDAMAMGKTPIVTAAGGYLEYMNDDCGWLVENYPTPAFAAFDTLDSLHTSQETWSEVDLAYMRRSMREAFVNTKAREVKARHGIERAYAFSHHNIGQRAKSLLTGGANKPHGSSSTFQERGSFGDFPERIPQESEPPATPRRGSGLPRGEAHLAAASR